MANLTREQLAAIAWERGLLEYKLDDNQVGMRRVLELAPPGEIVVADCSRQLGKSFWLCVEAIERAKKNPGWEIKYAAPTAKAVKKIIRPHFRDILRDCPRHLRPTFHTQEGEYRFPNGSVITVAGTEKGNIESLRGQHAHFAIVDEAGFMDDLGYIVKSVLAPQTTNTGGQLVIASTPAKSPGHEFKDFCAAAMSAVGGAPYSEVRGINSIDGSSTGVIGFSQGAYIERQIFCNPRLGPRDFTRLARLVGGVDSTDWKREYLGQHVTDESSAVLPEATAALLRSITLEVSSDTDISYRPRWFDAYTFVDIGWSPDPTGLLFAYWDFEHATLVIEDELLVKQMRTETLARAVRSTEELRWPNMMVGGRAPSQPFLRVGDLEPRLQADLASDHGVVFARTEKDDLDAQINNLRLMLVGKKGSIRIHPRCKNLLRQLANATWNKARTKFDRTEKDGHFDLVAALIYGARNINRFKNPVPDGADFNPATQYRNPFAPKSESGSAAALRKLFFGG